jgi:hypothetical protein
MQFLFFTFRNHRQGTSQSPCNASKPPLSYQIKVSGWMKLAPSDRSAYLISLQGRSAAETLRPPPGAVRSHGLRARGSDAAGGELIAHRRY